MTWKGLYTSTPLTAVHFYVTRITRQLRPTREVARISRSWSGLGVPGGALLQLRGDSTDRSKILAHPIGGPAIVGQGNLAQPARQWPPGGVWVTLTPSRTPSTRSEDCPPRHHLAQVAPSLLTLFCSCYSFTGRAAATSTAVSAGLFNLLGSHLLVLG